MQVIAIIGIVLIGGAYLGFIQLNVGQQPGPGPGPEPTPPADYEASAITAALQNAITGGSISGGNEGCDISKVVDGVWDPMTATETVADWSTTTFTSALTYSYGDTLVLHVYSDNDETGGTDNYDSWYYVTLIPGEPVRRLSPGICSVYDDYPTYKYKITGVGAETGHTVQYTSGTTNYWGLGVVTVMPRSTAANLDSYFTYGATTMASVADGTSFVDQNDEITANATLTDTDEDVYLTLIAGAANIGYGHPMYTVNSKGKFETRVTVAILSTDMTGIGVTELQSEGWRQISDGTLTSEKAFYKVLSPITPTKGESFTEDIKIPVDSQAAAASTAYLFKLFLIDFQLESNVAIGSTTTSIPSVKGMVGAYGIDAVIFARSWTVASGAADNEVLRAYLTTPS